MAKNRKPWAMDTSRWRKARYLPAGVVARILGVPPITLHRWMDAGKIQYEREGRYRFIHLTEMVRFVRNRYTEERLATYYVACLREEAASCG